MSQESNLKKKTNSKESKTGNPVFPKYAVWLLIITCVSFGITYTLSDFIPTGEYHLLAIPLDQRIPLWTPAVIVYILAYFQWIFCAVIVMKQKRQICTGLFVSIISVFWISFIIFLAFPTKTIRPEITGTGFCDTLLKYVYMVDAPTRICPSFHCILSWFCGRALFKCEGVPKREAWINMIFSVMVFASTLFTKQHVIIDLPVSIIVTEFGFLLSLLLHPYLQCSGSRR